MSGDSQAVQDLFGFNIEIVPPEKKVVTKKKRKASVKKVTAAQRQYATYKTGKGRVAYTGRRHLYVIYSSRNVYVYINKLDAQIQAARMERDISTMYGLSHALTIESTQHLYAHGCRVVKVQSRADGGFMVHIGNLDKRTVRHIVPVAYTTDALEDVARKLEDRPGRIQIADATPDTLAHVLDTLGIVYTESEFDRFSTAVDLTFDAFDTGREDVTIYDRITHRKRTRKSVRLIGPRGISHPRHNNPNKRTRKSSRLIGV